MVSDDWGRQLYCERCDMLYEITHEDEMRSESGTLYYRSLSCPLCWVGDLVYVDITGIPDARKEYDLSNFPGYDVI